MTFVLATFIAVNLLPTSERAPSADAYVKSNSNSCVQRSREQLESKKSEMSRHYLARMNGAETHDEFNQAAERLTQQDLENCD